MQAEPPTRGKPKLTPCTPPPGPRLPRTQLILAVNWKGMYFMDQKEKMLLELSFPEIMSLITNRWVSQGKRPQTSFLTTLVLAGSGKDGGREKHVVPGPPGVRTGMCCMLATGLGTPPCPATGPVLPH